MNCEFQRDSRINIAFKWDSEARQIIKAGPSPGAELGMLDICGINFLLITCELHCEPFLSLSAVFSIPHFTDQFIGQFIGEPLRRFGQDRYTAGTGFLLEFA